MARPGGNPNLKGKKGRSGRKSFSEELIKRAKELNHEELAKDILTQHLTAIKDSKSPDFKNTKDLALPIVLKATVEKKEVKEEVTIKGINYIVPDGAKKEKKNTLE